MFTLARSTGAYKQVAIAMIGRLLSNISITEDDVEWKSALLLEKLIELTTAGSGIEFEISNENSLEGKLRREVLRTGIAYRDIVYIYNLNPYTLYIPHYRS